MKALVIAEKPSVARDIARVLKCGKNINGAIEPKTYSQCTLRLSRLLCRRYFLFLTV